MLKFLSSIADISELSWDGLWRSDYPFVQHRFLRLLEKSGSTTRSSGWLPHHLVYQDGDKLLAAVLLYSKSHSYGEYVFDWAWADASERAGLNYYPKLLSAVPFTPAVGPRIALSDTLSDEASQAVLASVLDKLRDTMMDKGFSSAHILFPNANNRSLLQHSGYCERQGCQFHWFNHAYTDFDHFLDGLTSRKRKSIRKERNKVLAEDIQLEMRRAGDVSKHDWQVFFGLYHRTYLKRSGRPGYLTEGFFLKLAEIFPDQVRLCCAYRDGRMIAGALYFCDAETLYGRYWGAEDEFDGLHFEACYYQGIEFAIAQGLKRFDPGAQGEHKIQRGFVPVKTSSFHFMAHPGLHRAVAAFVSEEQEHNQAYVLDGRAYLPFKEGVKLQDSDCLL